ncbi:Ig-like domain-containing protein [Erwinia sp. CGal63]|uniref:Ig-like domain-containing protein n=1 Tax=Erwinia sp. CGal63 TaxID=2919889 RepID=UPI00300948E1
MANSGSGRITIVSLANGQSLTPLSDISAQVYALSEPGIVTLQGAPSQVTSWLQQDNDLILQQQDGSVTRFQQFFSADSRGQSQLVFQDGEVAKQIALATTTDVNEGVTTLTANWSTAESAASTLSINRMAAETATPVENHAAEVNSSASEADVAATANVAATATPSPTISVPFGDGWLNREEKLDGQTLSGSTGISGSGQQVIVNISGTQYQATVDDSGKWSLTLTSDQLMGKEFTTGKHWINVYASNSEGETGKASAYFFTDVSTPHVAFVEERDSVINLHNASISGVTLFGSGDAGDTLTVTLGPLSWQVTANSGGDWQVEVTPEQAQQLQAGDYTLTASISDTAKNVGAASLNVEVISGEELPEVTIDNLSADNRIDLTTINSDITISGTGEAGDHLRVEFGTFREPYWDLTVDSSGKWSVTLAEAEIQALASEPGYYPIVATITDANGLQNTATLNVNFYDVNITPTLTIDPISPDDIVVGSDIIQNELQLQGKASGIAPGTDLVVKIGDSTFQGVVTGAGWSASIDGDAIKALADGKYTLEISADNGTQSAVADRDFTLYTHFHSSEPTLTFNELTADDAFERNGELYYTVSGTITEGVLPASDVALYDADRGDYFALAINSDGTFSVEVPADIIASTDSFRVSYQDIVGNDEQSRQYIDLPGLPGTVGESAAEPHPTIDTPFGDGWLNHNEHESADQTLHGTTGVTGAGQRVTVNISGVNYEADVTGTGNWTLSLSQQQLAASGFNTGKHWINVTATNSEGETGTTQAFFFTDISTPQVTIDSPASDTTLDLSTITENYIFSGTGDQGDALTLTLGSLTWNVTVGFDGTWQAALTPEQAQQLETGDYRLQASIADTAKNIGTASRALELYHGDVLPQVTIDDLSADNRINLNSLTTDFIISGTAESAEYITIKLGDAKEWYPNIAADGSWQVELSEDDARQLATGDYTLTATVVDAGGNRNSASLDVEFYSSPVQPTLTISAYGDNNVITDADLANAFVEIRGTSTGLHSGDDVTLTFGDKTFTGVVYNNSWYVDITADDVKDLQDNFYTLTVSGTAEGGLTGSGSEDFLLLRYAHDPVVTVNPLTSDDAVLRDGVLYYEISGTVDNPFQSTNLALDPGGSRTYPLTVAQDGTFSLEIRADDYNSASGVHVDYTDLGGTKRFSDSIDLPDAPPHQFTEPTITFNPLTADDAYYVGNALHYKVSGTIDMPDPVTYVVLQGLTTMSYALQIADDGTFTVGVYAEDFTQWNVVHLEYTDATGERQIGTQTYTWPALPTAETTESASASLLAEDNPTDGDGDHASASVDHSSVTDDSATTTSDVAAAKESGSESATAANTAHSENIDGAATVAGTAGDDTFTLSTLNLLNNLDGGVGHDTLVLSGSHEALDFASLGLKVSSVETIDLGSSGSNSLTLGQKDLLALTDNASETLTIKGADGSTVTLSTAEGGVWSDVGQKTVDGQQFDLYHNASASHEGTLADVLIQHNLQVQTA